MVSIFFKSVKTFVKIHRDRLFIFLSHPWIFLGGQKILTDLKKIDTEENHWFSPIFVQNHSIVMYRDNQRFVRVIWYELTSTPLDREGRMKTEIIPMLWQCPTVIYGELGKN